MFEDRSEAESGSAVPSLDDVFLWPGRPATAPRWVPPQPGEEDVFGRIVPEPSDGPSAAEAKGSLRATSPAVSALVEAVDQVLAQAPAELPEAQALADTAELLRQIERLQAGMLGRVADVDARQLYLLDDAASTSRWVRQQDTSMDAGQVALAKRMAALPTLDEAVRDGRLSVAVAEKVGKALGKLRRHVDRPDGLIDGQDAEQALTGVIGHGIRNLICEGLGGLEDTDPRLAELIDQLTAILETPTSQLARLEAGFLLLAESLEPRLLPDALGRLVDALLPNELEKRFEKGHDDRGFSLTPVEDGWIPGGKLDLETGELLSAFLDAELAVDPDNPTDTDAYRAQRADGWQPEDGLDDLPADLPAPRSLKQRRHDALRNGLRRYLDAGIAGLRDKVSPHIGAVVGLDLLDGVPGALPAVSTTTRRTLPASLVRSWLCDSAISRFVLSLGNKVLETSHTARSLKPHERRAKWIETGGRCQAAHCRCGPHTKIIPHHVDGYARCGTTSIDDTANLGEPCHTDVHVHKRTIRLRDGRRLNENGWIELTRPVSRCASPSRAGRAGSGSSRRRRPPRCSARHRSR